MRKTILYLLLAGVIILCFHVAQGLPVNEEGVLFGINYNLFCYAAILGGAYLLFFAAIVVAEKKRGLFSIQQITPHRLIRPEKAVCAGLLLLAAYFLYRIYCGEGQMLGFSDDALRHHVVKPLYAGGMACLFGVFLAFDGGEAETNHKLARALFCVMAAGVCALSCYTPNPFLDGGGGLYHIHAYTNSIIHVAQGKPFDEYNVSVYGHYALLYLPLMKLLGNNYQAIARSIVLVAFVAYGAAFWACNLRIRKTSAFLLTVAAICMIPMMLYCSGQYYQVSPHRLLFPALTILLVSWKSRQKKTGMKGLYGFEVLLGTLAMIWNTETGLFSLAVLLVFNFMMLWQQKEQGETISSGGAARRIGGSIGMIALCLVLAYGAVNGYTLLAGGKLMSLERFIYPLLNNYYIEYMRWQLPPVFSLYIVQIVLFSVGVFQGGFALYEKAKGMKDDISWEILLCCVSVSGLAAITYFMNRTAYANISVSCMQMALVLGLLADGAVREAKTKWAEKRSLLSVTGKGICLLFLFVFATESALCFEKAMENRANTDWQKAGTAKAAEWVRSLLPENTTGMGMGVPELFLETHRDPGCTLIDWPDMIIDPAQTNLQKAQEIINEGREYLFMESQAADMMDMTGYESIETLEVGKFRYDLYRHIGSKE